jgi:hypothetical protein
MGGNMSLDNERKRILQLVNEKKITPEEGATLLETIRQLETPANDPLPETLLSPVSFGLEYPTAATVNQKLTSAYRLNWSILGSSLAANFRRMGVKKVTSNY